MKSPPLSDISERLFDVGYVPFVDIGTELVASRSTLLLQLDGQWNPIIAISSHRRDITSHYLKVLGMSKWLRHVVLDVESDGPCPGLYNMISFGLVSVSNPELNFLGEVSPVVQNAGIPAARDVCGISFETQKSFKPPEDVMKAAADWLNKLSDGKRITVWSDNPAFDWQFWNWYCHKYLGENPAGFSARRIGDLDAGRRREPLNPNAWKKHRLTKHTHNPVDDARGNVEALRWILDEMEQSV